MYFSGIWSSLLHVGFLWLGGVGALFVAVHSLPTAVASLVAEHGLQGEWASVAVAHRLSCFAVYGCFPDQGLNLCPLHWQMNS